MNFVFPLRGGAYLHLHILQPLLAGFLAFGERLFQLGIVGVDAPLPQAGVYGGAQQAVDHRGGGGADEDAGNAQHAAPEQHGEHGPDRGQADGGAHHPGIDEVAFNLLQAQQENQEDQYDENTDEEDQEEISEDGEYTEDDGYTEDEDSDSEDSSDDENTDSSDDESTSDSSDGVEYDEYGNVIDSDNTVNPEDVDTSSSSSSSSSGSGSSIVDYALQFVGNPYVWGGTSLTSGADCSGFTQSVYAQFGYSLPRTSYEQQNWGTEVSYADAQPGDLICYGGHVAIYMGNGQIVHASNSQDGIKISNDATYRTILSVRRPS